MSQHNNNLNPGYTSSSTLYFITSETWEVAPGGPPGWAETGIINTWSPAIGNEVYAWFEFDETTSGQDSGIDFLNYTAPYGTNHVFQVSRSPVPNIWDIFIDNTLYTYSQNDGFWSGQAQAGGECYCNATNEHADTFDQQLAEVNPQSGQVVNWTGNAGYIVHPGMNGVGYNAHEWSWNAP